MRLSVNARETIEQCGLDVATTLTEDILAIVNGEKTIDQLRDECTNGADGTAADGWTEYVECVAWWVTP